MENRDDDGEEISEGKINNKDILSELELLNTIDMTYYKKRIENIIGRPYSNLFFTYFENVYKSKIKNKISAPLSDYLNIINNNENSPWMLVYKTIKFYSRDNLPVIISKYFSSKAELEFKFIFNEAKKYSNEPNKFIDIYILKMKKYNNIKLIELKARNESLDIFNSQIKKMNFVKTFLSKKTILRGRKANMNLSKNNEEVKTNSLVNQEEIKNKKRMRIEIMKKVHQLKINAIKEIEKYNQMQGKQRKKYGSIKSRFLDIFKKKQIVGKIFNLKTSRTTSKNIFKNSSFNIYNNSKKDDDYFTYYQKKKSSNNNSKLMNLYSKDNIYLKKNTKLFLDDKNSKSNFYIYTSQINSHHKNHNTFRSGLLSNNKRLNLKDYSKNINNKITLFKTNLNNKNILNNESNEYNILSCYNSKKNKRKNLTTYGNFSNRENIKRSKSGLNNQKVDVKSIIDKLEKKRNKELENLVYRNNDKYNYNNKIYELFKRTEFF